MTTEHTFSALSKLSKRDGSGLPGYRLALLGDCATQHLATALKGCAYAQNLALKVFDADYNQILPQVMDSNSETYAFKPDAVLIYMCAEKLYAEWCETPAGDRTNFAESVIARIQAYWGYLAQNCSAKVLQFTFAEYDDFVFGSYGTKQAASFVYQLRRLNLLLMDASAADKNVFLVDLCGIQACMGRERLFTPKLYYSAKMPLSLEALPLVAERVVDVIQALRGAVKKCIVLDLDNTLWGGVIGDDGLSGIQIGELGLGHAFTEFQVWLKELKRRGVLLAVCSKNEEAAAKEPFEKHGEMVLRLEDFSVFIANWEDKATNITRIQQTLHIGMDSIVFVDDNPFERDLVRSLIPEITVPELPEDPAEYLSYLQSLNLFETASYSDEDANRTDQYRAEAQRESLRQQYATFDEYLQSLEMEAVAAPFDAFHTPRIAQLTQRSNQFNLRTVRYTEAEIEAAAADPDKITLYFTLKDKLADHGLISVVIMEKQDNKNLFINTWLMSCRVLKRGMEEFIVNTMIETARRHNFETVTGEYIKTPKNAMVENIYEKLGLVRRDDDLFIATVDGFTYNKTFIKDNAGAN
jgi:FkbH-like protein